MCYVELTFQFYAMIHRSSLRFGNLNPLILLKQELRRLLSKNIVSLTNRKLIGKRNIDEMKQIVEKIASLYGLNKTI